MSPEDFAGRCRQIIAEQRGHEAHRSLDLLTNDALRALGYGEGIDIFEAAVGHWHGAQDPYPYQGPCPSCERRRISAMPTLRTSGMIGASVLSLFVGLLVWPFISVSIQEARRNLDVGRSQ